MKQMCHDQLDYFVFNYVVTLIPFILAFIALLYYMFIQLWSCVLFVMRRRVLPADDAARCTGIKLLLSAISRPLAKTMRIRLRWGVVRTIVTLVFSAALPSWLGLVTIFDCTRVQTADGEVWMNDMSRDKECFADDTYFTYVGMHLFIVLIWLVLVVLYIRKSRQVGSSYEDIANSYKVIACTLSCLSYSMEVYQVDTRWHSRTTECWT